MGKTFTSSSRVSPLSFAQHLKENSGMGKNSLSSVAVIPMPGLQFIRERLQNILMWKGKTNGSPFGGGEGSLQPCFPLIFSHRMGTSHSSDLCFK